QIAPVGVDVLAQQRHLADAVGGHRLGLGDELLERAADLAPARGGHDAVRARAVAANADLQPALKRARAVRGQMPREALELEVPLRTQRVADQELRELVHLPRSEGDIDEGRSEERRVGKEW